MSELSKGELIIMQLYPRDMNIYGDWGNTLVLKKRAEWHGYTPKIVNYNPGDTFPEEVDIIVGGGGQDSGQDTIQADLLAIAPKLHELTEKGTPMLMVCGLYQLFGRFFKTSSGHIIEGIGIFDLETHGGQERLVGNVTTTNQLFGDIVGYENHSGQTYLGKHVTPFGAIIRGAGNNGHDSTEGARIKNVIGTYLHGSILPKNPAIADFLLETAAVKKFGDWQPGIIDDRIAEKARMIAKKRPR